MSKDSGLSRFGMIMFNKHRPDGVALLSRGAPGGPETKIMGHFRRISPPLTHDLVWLRRSCG
jgi:hypothetical protein